MMHPTSKWLHIGCDEVFHLGYCDKCRYKEHDTLFLSHVARVATYARQKHNVIPIIWDDMLRQFSVDKIKEVQLGKLVEPMIWTYIRDIYRFIPYSNWMSYAELFDNIWTASAFKGIYIILSNYPYILLFSYLIHYTYIRIFSIHCLFSLL